MKKLAVLRSLFSLLAVLAFVLGACTQSAAVQSESSQESDGSGSSLSSQSESYSFVYTAYYDETKIDLCASRDLSKNVWASNDDNGGRLIVEQDGSETAVYSVGAGYRIYSPLWSPDGKYIAFKILDTSKSAEITQAYIYHMDSGKVTDTGLTAYLGRYYDGQKRYAWSADSSKLLIEFHPVFYWDVVAGKSVQVSDDESYDAQTNRIYDASNPAFSPDGTKIVYQVSYNGGTALKVYDCKTGIRSEISRFAMKEGYASDVGLPPPFWVSDTEVVNGALGYNIFYKVDINTKEKTEFLTNVMNTVLSPDGKHLAYQQITNNKISSEIILNLATMQKATMASEGSWMRFIWSADSLKLILTEKNLRVVDVKGDPVGQPVAVTAQIAGITWTKSGLYYEILKPIA